MMFMCQRCGYITRFKGNLHRHLKKQNECKSRLSDVSRDFLLSLQPYSISYESLSDVEWSIITEQTIRTCERVTEQFALQYAKQQVLDGCTEFWKKTQHIVKFSDKDKPFETMLTCKDLLIERYLFASDSGFYARIIQYFLRVVYAHCIKNSIDPLILCADNIDKKATLEFTRALLDLKDMGRHSDDVHAAHILDLMVVKLGNKYIIDIIDEYITNYAKKRNTKIEHSAPCIIEDFYNSQRGKDGRVRF